MVSQPTGHDAGGSLFLTGRFGVLVQVAADFDQLFVESLETLLDGIESGVGFGRAQRSADLEEDGHEESKKREKSAHGVLGWLERMESPPGRWWMFGKRRCGRLGYGLREEYTTLRRTQPVR
jgi:hypothetical protein